jgi:hypothetical protein
MLSKEKSQPDLKPVRSSMFSHVDYDEPTRVLTVKYKTSGQIYHHEGVSRQSFMSMMAAESIGKHFNQHILKQHPGKRHQG